MNGLHDNLRIFRCMFGYSQENFDKNIYQHKNT